jgi:hypothetical protein
LKDDDEKRRRRGVGGRRWEEELEDEVCSIKTGVKMRKLKGSFWWIRAVKSPHVGV